MKKCSGQWWKSTVTLVGIFLMILIVVWWTNTQKNWKCVDTVADVIAGKGMQRLVKDVFDPPLVALTFDDGPNEKYTKELLDGLKERDVKASFFLLGKSLEGNEELVRQMCREGHLIGNHTFNHVQLDKASIGKVREEIITTNNRIYEITGVYPVYMRPPYGAWKKDMEFCVEMIPVFWTIDTLDWKTKDVSSIMEIVQKNVKNGSILLMHDEYKSTVEAALMIVDELTKKGFKFVTVDRLILP